MRVKKNGSLPPFVDVSVNGNKNYWMSSAIPFLPAGEFDGRDFSGIVLTAFLAKAPEGRFVELRVERRPFTVLMDGTATCGGNGQTIAFGCMPASEFVERMKAPRGRVAHIVDIKFHEDVVGVKSTSVLKKYWVGPDRGFIDVNVSRYKHEGEDRWSGMSFSFLGDCESLAKWSKMVSMIVGAKK